MTREKFEKIRDLFNEIDRIENIIRQLPDFNALACADYPEHSIRRIREDIMTEVRELLSLKCSNELRRIKEEIRKIENE